MLLGSSILFTLRVKIKRSAGYPDLLVQSAVAEVLLKRPRGRTPVGREQLAAAQAPARLPCGRAHAARHGGRPRQLPPAHGRPFRRVRARPVGSVPARRRSPPIPLFNSSARSGSRPPFGLAWRRG